MRQAPSIPDCQLAHRLHTEVTSSFDEYQDSYREAVNSSIGFSGADVDFFAKLKADDLVETLGRRLDGSPEPRVLDVGCGSGLTDAYLVGRLGELHGADVSKGLLETAQASNPGVEYHWFNGAALPFDDGAFDVSFAICVLHHVEPGERGSLVREMRRVTRGGGLVTIYEHNPFNPLTRIAVNRCEFDRGVHLLRSGETRRLLRGAGAPPVESRYIAFFPWETPVLRRIERGLSRLPLGGQYVVVGRAEDQPRSAASTSSP
jgi:SAM-dependent methyltransferase